MMTKNNIYDESFELYLVTKGYDLDTISLKECLAEIKIYNKINK